MGFKESIGGKGKVFLYEVRSCCRRGAKWNGSVSCREQLEGEKLRDPK